MKRLLSVGWGFGLALLVTSAFAANYNEAKVPSYVLEKPLKFLNGPKVTAKTWPERRREILDIFAREEYGVEPPKPEALEIEKFDDKVTAAGFAIRRQYRMWFKADRSGPCISWIVWLPRHARKPVPAILFLNYRGNHELVPDADIPVTGAWLMTPGKDRSHRADPASRGILQDPNQDTVFPLGMILARGYAVMSACYGEVSPDPNPKEKPPYDQDHFAYTGVFDLWGPRDPARTDNTGALGAWGWALSRGLDLVEKIPEIDSKRTVLTGYSRLGKAALIAMARDERFACCVPVQTGLGGTPLAKRGFGATIWSETVSFHHWYCKAFLKYQRDPSKSLTFDQHLFLACIAPRPLLVEGFDNGWFDPRGEFLALRAASEVWELLCGEGLPKVDYPDNYDESAIGRRLGYVRRTEQHGISAQDWTWLLNFADRALPTVKR